MAGEMSVWVCEDPEVVELVNAATEAIVSHAFGQEVDWARVREAAAVIRIPEDER